MISRFADPDALGLDSGNWEGGGLFVEDIIIVVGG
jgi:hypothetical protein